MRVSAGGSGSKKQQPKKIDVANISAQKTEDGLNSALAKLAGRQGLGPKPKAAEQPPTQKAPTPPPAASAGNASLKPPSKAMPTDKAQVVGKGMKQPDLQQQQQQQKKPSTSVASPAAISKGAAYEEEKLWKEVDAAVSRMGPMADIEEEDRSDDGAGSAASRPSSSASSSGVGFKQAPAFGGPRGFGASSSGVGGAVGVSEPRGFRAPAPAAEQAPVLEGASRRDSSVVEEKSNALSGVSAVPPQQQPLPTQQQPQQQQPQSRERRPPIRIMLFSMDEASTMEAIKVCGKLWDGVEKLGRMIPFSG